MNIFELFGVVGLKGTDKVKSELSSVEKRAAKVSKGLKITGAAFTAVGAAGLVLVQKTKKVNASLSVTGKTVGATTKEMRDLTLETTNVTFPIDEVTSSFDLLARAGVRDTEVLKTVATAFDTLGDATGLTASQVTKIMVPAMKTFNLTAEQMAGKTDLMTFMTRNSTLSLDDFNTMVGYTTPQLVEQGLTIEDLTAGLMHMEKQGYAPGRVMTREFMKATTKAAAENISLTEALGMTEEELKLYKEEMAAAEGITQDYADAANEQFTIMDKVKQKFSELTLKASGFLEPMEPLLAGMTALGPLMIGLSTSAGTAAVKWGLHTIALVAHKVAMIASAVVLKAVTVAQWLFNAAMTANPIGLVIAAVVALIAVGVALWQNWEKVTNFFQSGWSMIKRLFGQGAEDIADTAAKINAEIQGLAENMVETIRKEVEEERTLKLKGLEDSRTVYRQDHDNRIAELRKTYGILEREDEKYQDNKLDSARRATDAAIELIDEEYFARLKLLDDETAAVVSEYQDQIDALDDRTDAEERQLTQAEYIKRKIELQGRIESAATEEERIDAIADLRNYEARADRDRLLQSRRDEKEILRERIEEAKDAAKTERTQLSKIAAEKKDALATALKEELVRIDEERIAKEEAADEILAYKIDKLDDERVALTKHYARQLSETKLHVAALNRATAQVVGIKESSLDDSGRFNIENESWFNAIPRLRSRLKGFANGGLITEPTMLYGLQSKRPYAIAGEAGIERVAPIDSETVTNNFYGPWFIREEADVQKLARELLDLQTTKVRATGG